MLKKILIDTYNKEFYYYNAENIKTSLRYTFKKIGKADFKVLDLGCGNGSLIEILSSFDQDFDVYGVEGDKETAKEALRKGIKVKTANLEKPFPFDDETFDIIHGNQLFEHILNKDRFLLNCGKKLKKNGYLIISTENLCSIANIIALLLGYEPFSQVLSMKYHLGNPLSPHYMKKHEEEKIELFGHKMICSYLGLKELFKHNGFKIIKCLSAGFFPLPQFFARLDPRHARFITILAQKDKDTFTD
ncbi:MAG: class I SAM-dependent methyltransferase [bacterium]